MSQFYSAGLIDAIPDSGLVHRYDATELSLNDGDLVSTWPDIEGADDLTAGTAPTYKTSIIGGNPVVRHDGVDDYLSTSWSTTLSEPYMFFIVAKLQNAGSSNQEYLFDGTSAREHRFSADPSNDRYIIIQSGSLVNGGSTDGVDAIYTTTWRSGSSADEVRKNGTQIISGDSGNSDSNGLETRRGGTNDYGEWDIGEIIVYNTELSTSDRDSVESYLADKWGITI